MHVEQGQNFQELTESHLSQTVTMTLIILRLSPCNGLISKWLFTRKLQRLLGKSPMSHTYYRSLDSIFN